jgi:hypothetical protein
MYCFYYFNKVRAQVLRYIFMGLQICIKDTDEQRTIRSASTLTRNDDLRARARTATELRRKTGTRVGASVRTKDLVPTKPTT